MYLYFTENNLEVRVLYEAEQVVFDYSPAFYLLVLGSFVESSKVKNIPCLIKK